MCPSKQLLSVFFDGELPAPWDAKMASHIETCAECRKTIESYDKLRSFLSRGDGADFSEARSRVRERLMFSERGSSQGVGQRPMRRFPLRFAGERVSVPLPIAAAAALVFAAFAAIFALTFSQRGGSGAQVESPVVAQSINLEPDDFRTVTSISDALRLIENDGVGSVDYVIMRLPENKTFRNIGTPQLRNASTGVYEGKVVR